ncbi:MAG: hypothetical protein R6V53_05830 [Candidatus Woesearchaeota archaeon]
MKALRRLVNKPVVLTSRGNVAIKEALKHVRSQGGERILIPDQGGWLTYQQFPPKLGLSCVEVKTDDAVFDLDDLARKAKDASALLYEQPAGYFAHQDMKRIYDICKKEDCLVIADVSGCIGDEEIFDPDAADIIVCSFGEGKAIDVGYGGLIAGDISVAESFDHSHMRALEGKLHELPRRLRALYAVCDDIKQDFLSLHHDRKGIVVVVPFEDEKTKEEIISYCGSEGFEYTECPRYIRVLRKAISIEVKRKIF